nr:CoA-binding protein [Achromobacter sp. DMS1]
MLAKHGYAGPVYPINPKGGVIQGLPAYASVLDTPAAAELAILAVPAAATPAALRDCAARGVQAAIVLSSGFVEAGPEAPPCRPSWPASPAPMACACSVPIAWAR